MDPTANSTPSTTAAPPPPAVRKVGKVVLYLLGGLAAAIVVFAVVVALQPEDFRLARSTKISASRNVTFAQVDDFHNWEHWSPWAKLDPQMKVTFGGPERGTGATYAWEGNDQVGAGKMTILESKPGELVRIQLEFLRPFAATNTTDFTFDTVGDQTEVHWVMTGKNDFMGKAMGLLLNIDELVGKDFEKGLASLKATAEGAQ